MKEYVTEFKDYRDLPFSRLIQDELFSRHEHDSETGAIIYSEKDVLILLQMLQNEKSYIDLQFNKNCSACYLNTKNNYTWIFKYE